MLLERAKLRLDTLAGLGCELVTGGLDGDVHGKVISASELVVDAYYLRTRAVAGQDAHLPERDAEARRDKFAHARVRVIPMRRLLDRYREHVLRLLLHALMLGRGRHEDLDKRRHIESVANPSILAPFRLQCSCSFGSSSTFRGSSVVERLAVNEFVVGLNPTPRAELYRK